MTKQQVIDILESYKPSGNIYNGYNSIEEKIDERICYLIDEIIESVKYEPEPTYCHYCYEDSDGFVYALEKNGHAVIHGNKLMLAAKGWRGEIDIKYCPMCGRRLER